MTSIQFDRVSFAYDQGDEILRELTLACTPGWTALVGDNGAGKSTLVQLAAGQLRPTRGHVRRVHVESIAVVDQRVDAPAPAIADLAERVDKAALRWRARLGLAPDGLGRWPTLSPGERKRWQLAAALAREPDLLVVDEPGNHLDAEALAVCAEALAAYRGIGLLVSHDRALIARLAEQTIRVHAGTAHAYPGDYDAARAQWEAAAEATRERKAVLATARRTAERQLVAARDRERSATRGVNQSARIKGPKDSDARSMGRSVIAGWAQKTAGREVDRLHTRVDAARDAERALWLERERGAPLWLAGEPAPRRWLVQLDLPALRAGDTVLATAVQLAVARDDRLWIAGPNGAGKSTLVAALLAACTLPPERVLALPQDLPADAGASLARELAALAPAQRGRLGQLADALGIAPERALRSSSPSPGETRKLAIAVGLTRQPWLVVLDEPTHHLDLPSVERLEAALASYPGALVLVTHDERLAARLTTARVEVSGGAVVRRAAR